MKELLSNKWAWAVAALVILNVISLSTIWFATCQHHKMHRRFVHSKDHMIPGPGFGHHMGIKFLSEKLNLTEAQQKTFSKLREEHFNKIEPILEELQKTKAKLLNNLGSNSTEVDSLIGCVGKYESDIQKNTYDHFSKMYHLCDDKQKEELKRKLLEISTIKHVIKLRGPRGKHVHEMPPPEELDEEEQEPLLPLN